MYERLRELITERGITFVELAEKSGVPLSTLNNLRDRKEGTLSMKNAMKISKYLGIPIEELCEGVEI